MNTRVVLQASAVNAWQGQRQVLCGASLEILPATWTCIVGPNGAGKTSLLKVLAGLMPYEGEVRLFERSLMDCPLRERAQQLSWLGQDELVSDDLHVWDVVMLGRLPHQDWWGTITAQDEQIVQACLTALHAWDWRHRSIRQLSNGERQRVLLARLLAVQAQVVLMDEPLANLDPPHQVDWLNQVQALVEQGRTVVTVLHEIGMALHADDVIVMHNGCVMHHGPGNAVHTHQAMEQVFDHRIQIAQLNGQWVVVPVIAK